MQAYLIKDLAMDDARVPFKKTLKEAHDRAKLLPKDTWGDQRIQLVNVPTDAASVIGYLNGGHPDASDLTPLRTWKLSPRGGLVELGEDGAPLSTQDGAQ